MTKDLARNTVESLKDLKEAEPAMYQELVSVAHDTSLPLSPEVGKALLEEWFLVKWLNDDGTAEFDDLVRSIIILEVLEEDDSDG